MILSLHTSQAHKRKSSWQTVLYVCQICVYFVSRILTENFCIELQLVHISHTHTHSPASTQRSDDIKTRPNMCLLTSEQCSRSIQLKHFFSFFLCLFPVFPGSEKIDFRSAHRCGWRYRRCCFCVDVKNSDNNKIFQLIISRFESFYHFLCRFSVVHSEVVFFSLFFRWLKLYQRFVNTSDNNGQRKRKMSSNWHKFCCHFSRFHRKKTRTNTIQCDYCMPKSFSKTIWWKFNAFLENEFVHHIKRIRVNKWKTVKKSSQHNVTNFNSIQCFFQPLAIHSFAIEVKYHSILKQSKWLTQRISH